MCPESTAGPTARFVRLQPSWALAMFQTRPVGKVPPLWSRLRHDGTSRSPTSPFCQGNSSGAPVADLDSDGLDAEVWTALRGGRVGPGHRGGRTLDADLAMARRGSRPNPSGGLEPGDGVDRRACSTSSMRRSGQRTPRSRDGPRRNPSSCPSRRLRRAECVPEACSTDADDGSLVPGRAGRDQAQLWKRQSTSFLRTRAHAGRGVRSQSHPCFVDLGFDA